MPSPQIERKLAAIMFTDIAGYTAQISKDQVQEKADNLEPDVAAKCLNYPIPQAIVEEWERVE